MPKVKLIVNEIVKKCPATLPPVSQVFESDPERIKEAIQAKSKDVNAVAMLRMLLSEVQYKLKSKDFLNSLTEITVNILSADVQAEARLRISAGIILAEDIYRTTTIDKHLQDLSTSLGLTLEQIAKVEEINAGNSFLKGDYSEAAMRYLASARMEAYVKDQGKKMELINKAIAFAFVAPINQATHKVICALCLNEVAQRSPLAGLVSKLYREDIITRQEVGRIQQLLPSILKVKDADGISKLDQAAFSHNMIPIINSFSTIRLKTLLGLIHLKDTRELLILLEKTYQGGEIKIDQIDEVVHIQTSLNMGDTVKEFLTQIDEIIKE